MASYGLAPLSREYGGALSDLVEVPFADAMLVPLPDRRRTRGRGQRERQHPRRLARVAPFLAERPGAPVLVLGGAGGGSVGLYAAAVAVALGSERVDYVDEDADRLAVAERIGANAMEEPIGKRYGPYPITVNHTTEPSGLTTALRSTEPGGTCTSTTIYFGSDIAIPMLEMYTTGVTLTTSRVSARAAHARRARAHRVGPVASRARHRARRRMGRGRRRARGAHPQDRGRATRAVSQIQAIFVSSKRKRRMATTANSDRHRAEHRDRRHHRAEAAAVEDHRTEAAHRPVGGRDRRDRARPAGKHAERNERAADRAEQHHAGHGEASSLAARSGRTRSTATPSSTRQTEKDGDQRDQRDHVAADVQVEDDDARRRTRRRTARAPSPRAGSPCRARSRSSRPGSRAAGPTFPT